MPERHAYIKCKICGAHHRGVEHDWGSKPSAPSIIDVTPLALPPPTLAEIKKATADLERVFPTDVETHSLGYKDTDLATGKTITVRGTPRKRAPKGAGFDRKAYQREKARERRAAKKAEAKPK